MSKLETIAAIAVLSLVVNGAAVAEEPYAKKKIWESRQKEIVYVNPDCQPAEELGTMYCRDIIDARFPFLELPDEENVSVEIYVHDYDGDSIIDKVRILQEGGGSLFVYFNGSQYPYKSKRISERTINKSETDNWFRFPVHEYGTEAWSGYFANVFPYQIKFDEVMKKQ